MEDTHTHTVVTGVEGRQKRGKFSMMPGPRDNFARCFILRDRRTSSFTLWDETPPTVKSAAALEEGKSLDNCEEKQARQVGKQVNGAPAMEEGKFLLAAQKLRGLRSTEYIISSNPNPSKNSNVGVLGKLKSNFWNTEFAIYESQQVHKRAVLTVKPTSRRHISSSKISPIAHAESVEVAAISYKVPLTCPASLECSLFTVPASAMDCTFLTVPCLCSSKSKSAVEDCSVAELKSMGSAKSKSAGGDCSVAELKSMGIAKSKSAGGDCYIAELHSMSTAFLREDGPFVLNSKTPRWNPEQSKTLRCVPPGRVLLPSVKNCQLPPVKNYQPDAAAATEPQLLAAEAGPLLQFGRMWKDLYIMDYSFPLSAFQGFTIFLSGVDAKFPNAYFP